MDVSQDDFSDLLTNTDFAMDFIADSHKMIDNEISTLQNASNLEDKLESAKKLVLTGMSTTSIIVVENKILKYLFPTLKTMYLDIFKEIANTVSSEKSSDEKLEILTKHLQTCISILKILDNILENLFKNERFDLADTISVPLNTVEMLFVTFEHCKSSNSFYEGIRNMKDILNLFKTAYEVHTKLISLMERHINITITTEEEVSLLKSFLESLVKIGGILSCMNKNAMLTNWRGYVGVQQKFSQVLSGRHSIKDTIECVSMEMQKNLNGLLKDSKNKNLNSITKLCTFLIKVIVKSCEVFLEEDEEDWEQTFAFLLNIYSYHPFLLKYKGYSNDVVNEFESGIFCAVQNLLEKLCGKAEFCKNLMERNKTHAPSETYLLLFLDIFKNSNSLSKPEVISNAPQMIELFFNVLSKGYYEFWKLILIAPSNQILYEEHIKNLAQIVHVLPTKEYNQVERVLFENIFSECVWNSSMANDVWYMALRDNHQLCYETLCNLLKLSDIILTENFADRPQFIFLKNLLTRLSNNLSENHKQLLLNQYPLNRYLYLWRVLGFQNFLKSELSSLVSVTTTVISKSNLLINKKISLEEFNILCDGLNVIALVPKNSLDSFKVTTTLFNLWKFIFGDKWRGTFYFKYFVKKLLAATNNFLLEFTSEQLLLILEKMMLLLNTDSSIKIQIGLSLTVLSKKNIQPSPRRSHIFTSISELFYKLLTNKNKVIQQNALEVFMQFSEVTDYDVIVQNSIKNDYELQTRISNFVQNNVDTGGINWEEYFRLQSNYKFRHVCPGLENVKSNGTVNYNCKVLPNVGRGEIDDVLKNIRSNVELFYKLSGKDNVMQESVTEIMRILHR